MKRYIFSGAGVLLFIAALRAQQPPPSSDEEGTRMLWDSTFLRKRPPAKPTARPGAAPVKPLPTTARLPPAEALLGDGFVGITLWRLRPSSGADEQGVRVLVYETRKDEQWTPERVSLETPLAEGQMVRLSIESARAGYLYVIDREQYRDGSVGDPFLIFPIQLVRDGKNAVEPGSLVEIPSWDGTPPYLKLKRSRPEHVGELLTLLVTPEPIPGLRIGREPLKLAPDQVSEWESRWSAQVKQLDARKRAGTAYTLAEKQAAQGPGTLLGAADPLPQTIFHVETKSGAPMLVTVPLRIGR